jgi:hypothetical protein
MTDEQISTAAEQWANGVHMIEIGHYLGLSRWQTLRMMERYRHMFPKRVIRTGKYGPRRERSRDRRRKLDFIPKPKNLGPDQMEWVTVSGAAVTLPRISLISCPRSV